MSELLELLEIFAFIGAFTLFPVVILWALMKIMRDL